MVFFHSKDLMSVQNPGHWPCRHSLRSAISVCATAKVAVSVICLDLSFSVSDSHSNGVFSWLGPIVCNAQGMGVVCPHPVQQF